MKVRTGAGQWTMSAKCPGRGCWDLLFSTPKGLNGGSFSSADEPDRILEESSTWGWTAVRSAIEASEQNAQGLPHDLK